MNFRRILLFQGAAGSVVSLASCLLQWGVRIAESRVVHVTPLYGFQLYWGSQLFGCSLLAAAFLYSYSAKKSVYWLSLGLLAGLAAMLSPLTWVMNPSRLTLVWRGDGLFNDEGYTVTYGGYVALVGSAIFMSSIALEFLNLRKRQASMIPSKLTVLDKLFLAGGHAMLMIIAAGVILVSLNASSPSLFQNMFLIMSQAAGYGLMLLVASIMYIGGKKVCNVLLSKKRRRHTSHPQNLG